MYCGTPGQQLLSLTSVIFQGLYLYSNELMARVNPELTVGAAQVRLDGVD
jgi:hypothetical protein